MLKVLLLSALVSLPAMADESFFACEGKVGGMPFTAFLASDQMDVVKGHGVSLDEEPPAEKWEHFDDTISSEDLTDCRLAGLSAKGAINVYATDCEAAPNGMTLDLNIPRLGLVGQNIPVTCETKEY